MKKLIPAICLLLIAACLMGTSTYAWFSMTKSASVSGMQVKAIAKGGLAIASYTTKSGTLTNEFVQPSADDYGSSVAAKWSNWGMNDAGTAIKSADLNPTSYSGVASGSATDSWYLAESDSANDYAAKSGGYETVTAGSAKNYYLMTKFAVKSIGSDTAYLYLSGITVSANANSAALNKSLRVLVICDGKAYTFAPKYDSTDTTKLYFYSGSSRTEGAAIVKGDAPDTKIYSTALTTTAVPVDVYVYYEGEDANCLSNNALIVDSLSVDLTFAAKDS